MEQTDSQQGDTQSPVLPDIEPAVVEIVARRAIGDPGAQVERWQIRPLAGGLGSAGVYRVSGSVQTASGSVPWSAVLKMRRRFEDVVARGWHLSEDTEATGWRAWEREFLTYVSGVLDDLPAGIRAARCLYAEAPAAGMRRLWLEDLVDHQSHLTAVDRFRLIAEQVGKFNGIYFAGRPLPAAPHLRHSWLRTRTASGERLSALLQLHGSHHLVQLLMPLEVREGALRLLERRSVLLDALDQLPRTFCHRDLSLRNLFIPGQGGNLVAIDWEFAGIGAIGEDGGSIVAGGIALADLRPEQYNGAEQAIFTAYVAGLRSAGWRGDVRLVRLAYTTFVSLHGVSALLPDVLTFLAATPEPELDVFYQDQIGLSVALAMQRIGAQAMGFAIRLGDEACRLIEELQGDGLLEQSTPIGSPDAVNGTLQHGR